MVEVRNRSEEMFIEPASDASVEFALGRLAITSNNSELANAHAESVIARVPASPAGYELKAYAAREMNDPAALAAARDRAIELGSRDSWVYTSKADGLVYGNDGASGALDDLMLASTAREAADLYQRALGLRPGNTAAVPGFVLALLNLDVVTDADNLTLNASRIMLPTNGLLLVGQAAVEKESGNVREEGFTRRSPACARTGKVGGTPSSSPRSCRTVDSTSTARSSTSNWPTQRPRAASERISRTRAAICRKSSGFMPRAERRTGRRRSRC
jgi:hypothetical protein